MSLEKKIDGNLTWTLTVYRATPSLAHLAHINSSFSSIILIFRSKPSAFL